MGATSARIAAASSSHASVSGENTAIIAAEVTPLATIASAALRIVSRSKGTIGLPSNSLPSHSRNVPPSTFGMMRAFRESLP